MLPLDFTAATNMATTASVGQADPELAAVVEALLAADSSGFRFATVLRNTIDQLLDGESTGRYDWKTLFKTEKTHAGTVVEINLQREFEFADGDAMDYKIAGVDVDCKYSQSFGGWMIPPEAVGHLCLLVWADDYKSQWSAGLVRIRAELLNHGNNRDMKQTLNSKQREKVTWLWRDAELPENVLLHMDPTDREAVFAPSSGQARLNELFRRVQRRRIGRNIVRTVAQQKDYMKRVRGNGGSRSALRKDGILIMGDYESHKRIAEQLGGPVPREGEFVSVRVVEVGPDEADRLAVTLCGRQWACARAAEPSQEAPLLPAHTR